MYATEETSAAWQDGDMAVGLVPALERQAAQRHAATAVEGPSGRLSYAALTAQSNRLARLIASRLDGRGRHVALLLDQGAPFVTAALATLKAGHCLVALDPNLPRDRIRFMLRDAKSALVVSNGDHVGAAVDASDRRCEILDLAAADQVLDDSPVAVPVDPESPAYVTYTSGSTGMPKGVVHSHIGVLHNAFRIAKILHFVPGDRQTLLYPCGVYGGLRDIFNALLNGASLHHYDVGRLGVGGLADWINDRQITVYCSVVTVFRQLTRSLAPAHAFPTIRAVRLGGEAAAIQDVDRFRRYFAPSATLHVGFACTETGAALHGTVTDGTRLDDGRLPLGTPAEGVDVHLLDDQRQPVADGDVGEIVVRSRFLALGYFDRPELTDRVFVRDPAGGPERLYFTGDLGRRRPDGTFEHHGRKDLLVKIRGHRVELREVEIALTALKGVTDAVVAPRQLPLTGTQLIAFIVFRSAPVPDVELRASLLRTLPRHFLPSRFIAVDRILQTSNGKADRRALLSLLDERDAERPTAKPDRDPDPVEQVLLQIWRQVLGLEDISIRDDFFHLGGQSLVAADMFRLIEHRLGRRLPVSTLLRAPSIAELATVLSSTSAGDPHGACVPLRVGTTPPLFCVHGIGGEILFLRSLLPFLPADQSLYGLRAEGLDLSEFPNVEALASHYVHAIRDVQPHGPYFLAGYSLGGTIALEMAQQITAAGEQVPLLAIFDHVPANAPGRWPTWSLRNAAAVLGNIPFWLRDDFVTTSPWRLAVRTYGHAKALLARLGGRPEVPTFNTAAYFGVISLPARDEARCQALFVANRRYHPKCFAGRVAVFQARAAPLFHSRQLHRWTRLVPNGLEMINVPGNHNTLFSTPRFARVLASKLMGCLSGPAPVGRGC